MSKLLPVRVVTPELTIEIKFIHNYGCCFPVINFSFQQGFFVTSFQINDPLYNSFDDWMELLNNGKTLNLCENSNYGEGFISYLQDDTFQFITVLSDTNSSNGTQSTTTVPIKIVKAPLIEALTQSVLLGYPFKS